MVPPAVTKSFETEAQVVLRRLRRCTAAVLGGVRGVSRAIDVADRLGLDRSLAWKVWRVAHGEHELPSTAHIPGHSGFYRFLQGAGLAGAGIESIRDATEAFEQFERLAEQHAGDRATADIMLGALSEEGRERHELARRREAFRANTHFLGVQCRAIYQLDALLPAPAGFLPEVCRLRGHYGLVRTRANVPWLISKSTLVTPTGLEASVKREPLNPATSGEQGLGYGMIPAFCSRPLPLVRRSQVDDYTVEDELEPGAVGGSAAVDVTQGERVSNMPRRTPAATDAVTVPIFTPAERVCFDVIAHESLVEGVPLLKVNSTVHGDMPYRRGQDYDRIPVPEIFADLGSADGVGGAPEVPEHAAMLSWFLERLGHPPRDLRFFRARLRYPPMPCRIAAHYTFRKP